MGFWEAALGIGEEAKSLDPGQAVLRTVIVYAVTILFVRLGKKRFMGRGTAFDVIIGVMVGSVASRAVTANASLGPALSSVATLLALHWVFSALAVRWHWFGLAVKGDSAVLVRNGVVDLKALHASHLSLRDLQEDLREKECPDLAQVAEARLERDGKISIQRKAEPPRVIEVDVAAGVQRVRIEIG